MRTLRRLILGIGFVLLLSLSAAGGGRAETLLHDTNAYLPSAANTALGAVGHGWVDSQGVWQINADSLSSTGSGGFTSGGLLRPTSESRQDSRIVADLHATSGVVSWVMLRYVDASDYYAVQVNASTYPIQFTVYKIVGGSPTSLGSATLSINSYNDILEVDLAARGVSPTVFAVTVKDLTTPLTASPTVTSDSTPALQTAGQQGVLTQSSTSAFTRIQTFDEGAPQSLAAGALSAASTTSTSITPQLSGITGGTAPYSTTFGYSTTANGTYTTLGTPVAGASPVASTAASGLTPSTSYYFRAVTTDSAGTPATVTIPSSTSGTALATAAAQGSSSTVAPNDPHIYYSPGTWVVTSAQSYPVSSGAYLRLAFTGTSIRLSLDAANGSVPPYLKWSVDNASYQLTSTGYSAGVWTLGVGLTAGSHSLSLFVPRVGTSDRWTATSTNFFRFTGFTLDSGATLLAFSDASLSPVQQAALAVKPNVLLAFGDSRLEGPNSGEASSQPDATVSFVVGVAAALNAEYGQIGYSGTGYTATSISVPPLFTPGNDALSSWNKLDSAHARSFAGVTHVLVEDGANDVANSGATSASLRSSVAAFLPALRAALPAGAKVFLGADMGGYGRSDITSAFAAYQLSAPDALTALLATYTLTSLGVDQKGLATSATAQSIDGLHGTEQEHARWGAAIAGGMLSSGTSTTITVFRRRIN